MSSSIDLAMLDRLLDQTAATELSFVLSPSLLRNFLLVANVMITRSVLSDSGSNRFVLDSTGKCTLHSQCTVFHKVDHMISLSYIVLTTL